MKKDTYERLAGYLIPLEIAYRFSLLLIGFLALVLMGVWLTLNFFSFWLATFLGIVVCLAVAVRLTSEKIIPRLLTKHIVTTLEEQQPSMRHSADR